MKRVLLIATNESIISVLKKKYTNLCETSSATEMYSYIYDIDQKNPVVQQMQDLKKAPSLDVNFHNATRNIKLTQPKEITDIANCQDVINFIKNNKIELVITPGILLNSKRNSCYDHLVDVLNNTCEVEIISLYL